jgi:hypothetical protein
MQIFNVRPDVLPESARENQQVRDESGKVNLYHDSALGAQTCNRPSRPTGPGRGPEKATILGLAQACLLVVATEAHERSEIEAVAHEVVNVSHDRT